MQQAVSMLELPSIAVASSSGKFGFLRTQMCILGMVATINSRALADMDTYNDVPRNLEGSEKAQRIQRPNSPKAENCTRKCVSTCIVGGAGAPGEGPLNIRRPLVVFKEGFRSRKYWFHGSLDATTFMPIKVTTGRRTTIPKITNECCCEDEEGCMVMPPFKPYSAKVPWHKGIRALLCRAFPKYGNYCGPNYSSGRESGSLLWDKPPIDLLDYCCLQHDIGYDSYDQMQLYYADIALLHCLTRIPRDTSSKAFVREVYRGLCIIGLRAFLVPYRRTLLGLSGDNLGMIPFFKRKSKNGASRK